MNEHSIALSINTIINYIALIHDLMHELMCYETESFTIFTLIQYKLRMSDSRACMDAHCSYAYGYN